MADVVMTRDVVVGRGSGRQRDGADGTALAGVTAAAAAVRAGRARRSVVVVAGLGGAGGAERAVGALAGVLGEVAGFSPGLWGGGVGGVRERERGGRVRLWNGAPAHRVEIGADVIAVVV